MDQPRSGTGRDRGADPHRYGGDEVERYATITRYIAAHANQGAAEALNAPFLLLPFRPSSDPSPARSFINTFFKSNASGSQQYRGTTLQQELRLTDPTVLCSILKWCWSRVPKGVVSWPVYEAFQLGEKEANMARNAFDTFIPLGSDSPARTRIIIDFFDLLAAIAAHGKRNGLGGRKLSRLAGWWAFEHSDGGKGFDGGYRSWASAADASSHLFFAYLRSLSPDVDPSMNVIERIPRSLQALLAQTEYPPDAPALLQRTTPRVVMIVDQVSPTPFSLLRRAKHFEYRQNDRVLRAYSEFDDPVEALTDECKRVLYAIASTNSSGPAQSRHGLAKSEETWTSFTSVGFGDLSSPNGTTNGTHNAGAAGAVDIDRPTTPSWGDFLSSGFQNEVSKSSSTMLLSPDKVLPPIHSRTQTPSIRSGTDYEEDLAPGELAAITSVELDDAFWWVWMTSLAGEEPNQRKAVFGRCALIETSISNGQWLIMEEQVKGASPDPTEGAQIVEKKSRFSFSRRNKLNRDKSKKKTMISTVNENPLPGDEARNNRMTLSLEQENRIRNAAADLARKNDSTDAQANARRGRHEDSAGIKSMSTLTMGLQSEAGPAMKWAHSYDKDTIRTAYLGSNMAGTGQTVSTDNLMRDTSTNFETLPAVPPKQDLAPVQPAPLAHMRDDSATQDAFHSAKQSTEDPSTAAYDPLQKELGPAPETDDHPAYREDEPVKTQPEVNPGVLAARMALEGRAVSPESAKGNKLMKKQQQQQQQQFQSTAGGGGFKKFFTRKPDRRSVEVNRYPVNTGAASAASDAALNRKLAPIPDGAPVPMQVSPPRKPVVEPISEPQVPPNASTAALSRVDSRDQREADAAFSSFDQTAPAAHSVSEPRDSVDDFAEAPQVARYTSREAEPLSEVPEHYAPKPPVESVQTPMEEPAYHEDAQSETTMDDQRKEASPTSPQNTVDSSKDRWERIRENAARRAAHARASEEQSTMSRPTESGRTDDGETSGEESKFMLMTSIGTWLTLLQPLSRVLHASRLESPSLPVTWITHHRLA